MQNITDIQDKINALTAQEIFEGFGLQYGENAFLWSKLIDIQIKYNLPDVDMTDRIAETRKILVAAFEKSKIINQARCLYEPNLFQKIFYPIVDFFLKFFGKISTFTVISQVIDKINQQYFEGRPEDQFTAYSGFIMPRTSVDSSVLYFWEDNKRYLAVSPNNMQAISHYKYSNLTFTQQYQDGKIQQKLTRKDGGSPMLVIPPL